jgi:hypothetical protein
MAHTRKLPSGLVSAIFDHQTYGPWPGAVECEDCGGTGNFYGNDEDGDFLPCDECDSRGWNPPAGGPHELIVEKTTTYAFKEISNK